MTDKESTKKLDFTDDEIKIIDIFRKIPMEKQNEALLTLYILAENSQTKK